MNRYFKQGMMGFVLFFMCFCADAAQSQFSHSETDLVRGLNQMVHRYSEYTHIGIQIQSMNTGKILYEKNANQLFVPASTLKLFTHIAALLFLGPDFQFKTRLLADQQKISENTLKDDLYIQFSGDPSLTQNQLEALIHTLNTYKIKKITGHVYIDNTVFDQKYYAPGWMWDELNFCYAAPISAMAIDESCIHGAIGPNPNGKKASLQIFSQPSFVAIQNTVSMTRGKQGCDLDLSEAGSNQYEITGCMTNEEQKKSLEIAVRDPNKYAKKAIEYSFKKSHIQLLNSMEFRKTPISLPVLSEHRSEPLSVLLTNMSKNSNNVYANTIFKYMGHAASHTSGQWKNASAAMVYLLREKAGLNLSRATIIDGAGLSRYNLITASQLSNLLSFAYHHENIAPSFIKALPIAGVDGTLNKAMWGEGIQNKVFAKTGSMTGVRALAGYIETKQSGVLSFVILMNGLENDAQGYLQLEHDICQYLVTHS